jgi:hypothetical protein
MLDPSYLRSIRDGILTGNIEANNNEALPDGLVGLYDQELFPPSMKWKERKETLQLFLVFALAQKEISADFAAQVLGDMWYNLSDENTSKEEKRLQRVNDLIQLHSKRFGSAGGGKYRLYHERFRVYILQKVSQQDITQFNNKFISLCETALETISEKDIPEKESYALEFISTHFFISAMQGEKECLNKEKAAALKQYAYDHRFWERQVKASKGFEWSKHMLNQMMSWASKLNEDDEVIECALNKVDLYHQEQNDAPRIVQLVADGDIETALERIEKFGGEDKEGVQRKFTLYMLCLMELTLLDSKDRDHAKNSIEKILTHFDEQIPNPFNWNNFFPSFIILQLAFRWSVMGLGYMKIIGRNKDWEYTWIQEKDFFNDQEFEVLMECASILSSPQSKCDSLMMIYAKMLYQDKLHFANTIQRLLLECANSISDISVKIHSILDVSRIIHENGKFNDSRLINKEATGIALKMENNLSKIKALCAISSEMSNQRLIKETSSLIEETIKCAYRINEIPTRFDAFIFIAYELNKRGNQTKALLLIDEAEKLVFVKYTSSSKEKFKLILDITKAWFDFKKNEKSTALLNELINESLKTANAIELRELIVELIRQNQFEKAKSIVAQMKPDEKRWAYVDVLRAMQYPKHVYELLSLENQLPISYDVYYEYASALIKCNLIEKASEQIRRIDSHIYKAMICKGLINKYLEINDFNRANIYLDEIKSIYNSTTYKLDISPILKILSESYFLLGDFENAIILNSEILLNLGLNHSLKDMNYILRFFCFENKNYEVEYSIILEQIVNNYFKKNQKLDSIEILIKNIKKLDSQTRMLVKLRSISKKPRVLEKIKSNLCKLGINIRGGSMKYPIALKMIDQNLFDDALGIEFEEYDGYRSKEKIRKIIDNKLVEKLCYQEIENDNIDYVLSQIDKITDTQNYINTFLKLFDLIDKRNKYEFFRVLIEKIIGNLNHFENKKNKSWVLASLSTAQYKKGNYIESSRLMIEAERTACSYDFFYLSIELAKQKKISDAMKMANNLDVDIWRDRTFISISIELLEHSFFNEAMEILELIEPQSRHIQNEINTITGIMDRKYGLFDALVKIESIDRKILKEKLKSTILDSADVTKINLKTLTYILKQPKQSIQNIKHFLILYFTNQLFFFNLPKEKLDHYIRTLKLQWAIDIKNQLPN